MPVRRILITVALVSLLAAACSSGSQGGGGDSIAITATDSECKVAQTDVAAGRVAFRIHNGGDTVTEVYVYAADDKVLSEKENIGPGTDADLNVDLAAGDYEIACKPGMTGDGIRTEIHVTGEGGTK